MLPSFPVLLPLATGILLLAVPARAEYRRTIAVGSLVLQLAVSLFLLFSAFRDGVQATHLGAWESPIGIVLVGDKTSAILVLLALLVTLSSTISGFAEKPAREESPLRLPLVQFLLTGIQLSFLTGDLFNLFVAFEVMLLSSYGLLSLEAGPLRIREAYPYVIINLFASALFLAGCGYAYALFGTLNLTAIAEAARTLNETPSGAVRIHILTALLAFVFSVKAGMFPLYYWLPNSYPVLPASLGALYSGLLTKVGIYVLLRLLGTVMPPTQDTLYLLIAWLGGGTMLFGVLGAVSRMGMREILSFHVLSQVGFMIFAIGIFTPFAFAACIFYMIHHILVKSALFLCTSGVIWKFGTDSLKKTGGLWKSNPLLGIGFLLFALSLAGLPPLSGFWAKLWILLEGFRTGAFTLVAVSLVASLLTLVSMLKIWNGAFWNPAPDKPRHTGPVPGSISAAIALMLLLSIGVVLALGPLWKASQAAADELLDPSLYTEAVLQSGENP
ncbi:MAG: proton-conducting transporter membrane subunit [Oceanipulchritudo sp.]